MIRNCKRSWFANPAKRNWKGWKKSPKYGRVPNLSAKRRDTPNKRDFEENAWPDSTRYVWQPGTEYINNTDGDNQHSRQSALEENSPKAKGMNPTFKEEDFLNPPQSEQEARMRHVKYSLPETVAATRRDPHQNVGQDRTRGETSGTKSAELKVRYTGQRGQQAKTRGDEDKPETQAHRGAAIEEIDVSEIQRNAREKFREQGKSGETICITLDSSGSDSLLIQSCHTLSDSQDEHATRRKKGSKCPDVYQDTRAGTRQGDPDHYFADDSDQEIEKNQSPHEAIHITTKHPSPEAGSHFDEIAANMTQYRSYYGPAQPIEAKTEDGIIECVQAVDEPLYTFLTRASMKAKGAIKKLGAETRPHQRPHRRHERRTRPEAYTC